MRGAYTIKADKPLPASWRRVLDVLLEDGTAHSDDVILQCKGHASTTIRGVLSNMHQHGFVQRLPGRLWGLTHAGITAALHEEQAGK